MNIARQDLIALALFIVSIATLYLCVTSGWLNNDFEGED